MDVTKKYNWLEPNTTHGLTLILTNSEIDTLKLGQEAMKTFIETHSPYTNDHIEVIYDLIDKIIEVASENLNRR
jgi:hypothetical protein